MKLSILNITVLFLTISVFTGCEKQLLPEPDLSEPYLKFEAEFNGNKRAHKAGEANCFGNTYNSKTGTDSFLTYNFVLDDMNDFSRRYVRLSINNYTVPLINIDADKDSTIKIGSYNYHYFNSKPGNPRHLKEVTIIWYNQDKEAYSTFSASQKYSKFFIKSVKDTIVSIVYIPTKVKIAEIEFNCTLRNSFSGDTINLSQGFIRAIL